MTIRIDSTSRIIFPLKNNYSFKPRTFNIVAVYLYLAHSSLYNFCNTMPRREPVVAICQPSCSGSRGEDGVEFIRCVGGQEPQTHKIWSFAEDGINRKVHPFARIDVKDFPGDCFLNNYSTVVVHKVTIYGQMYINGSVEWLSVPAPFCYTEVASTDNLLVPEARWGDRGIVETWALGTQYGIPFRGVDVP